MSRPRSIQELTAEATIKENIQDYSFTIWCNSAKNLLSQSDEAIKEGNEERAYILFLKSSFLIVELLPKHKSFNASDPTYKEIKRKIANEFPKLEQLSEKLKKNYEKWTQSANKSPNSSATPQMRSSSLLATLEKQLMITPQELFALLNNPSLSILIFDLRRKEDFLHGHVRWVRYKKENDNPSGGVVNIEPMWLDKNTDATNLEQMVKAFALGNQLSPQLFQLRNSADVIVFHDEASEKLNESLEILQRAIKPSSQRVPKLLRGGYVGWLNTVKQLQSDWEKWIEIGEGSGGLEKSPAKPPKPKTPKPVLKSKSLPIEIPTPVPLRPVTNETIERMKSNTEDSPQRNSGINFEPYHGFSMMSERKTSNVGDSGSPKTTKSAEDTNTQSISYPLLGVPKGAEINGKKPPPPLPPKPKPKLGTASPAGSQILQPSFTDEPSKVAQVQVDVASSYPPPIPPTSVQTEVAYSINQPYSQPIQFQPMTNGTQEKYNMIPFQQPILQQPLQQSMINQTQQKTQLTYAQQSIPSQSIYQHGVYPTQPMNLSTPYLPTSPPPAAYIPDPVAPKHAVEPIRTNAQPRRSSSPSFSPVTQRYYTPHLEPSAAPILPPKMTHSIAVADTQPLVPIKENVPTMGSTAFGMSGLKNLGNTCFMNSTLQCLSATVPLTRYFLDGSFRRHINRTNTMGSKGLVAENFGALLKSMWSAQEGVVAPSKFKEVIGSRAPQFKGNEQQDSQEFLQYLLDSLHEDLNLGKKLPPVSDSEENENNPDYVTAPAAWHQYVERQWSIVVDMFQGQLKSQLKCLTCGKTSTTFNTFMYLSLPIPPKNSAGQQGGAVYIEECLDKFVEVEYLDGPDAWNCPRCKQPRRASKHLTIIKLPQVLMIHFKRFYYQGPFRNKIETYVEFPIQMNLEQYVPEWMRTVGCEYELYAISNHYGGLNGGHYTAFVRNIYRQTWYHFDDSRISPQNEQNVKSKAAYILFYVRKPVPGVRTMANWWGEPARM